MSIYSDLLDLISKYKLDEVQKLLKTLASTERTEVFNLAAQNNDYLVADTLLQWGTEHNSPLVLNESSIKNYSVNILAMLVDYGVEPNISIGETTLLGILQQRDPQLAMFLEKGVQYLQHLKSIAEQIITILQQEKLDNGRREALQNIVNMARVANVRNAISGLVAMGSLMALDEQVKYVARAIEQHDTSTDVIRVVNDEIQFAYALVSEFPYSTVHAKNFITRLKRLTCSHPSANEEPLIRALEAVVADFERTKAASSQSWLIKPTEALKEHPGIEFENVTGQCFGFGYMTLQAMVVGELENCKERINLIQSTAAPQLKETIQQNRDAMILAAKTEDRYTPSDAQLNVLEIEGFIQAIAFAQKPRAHPGFNIYGQDVLKISSVLMSKKLAAAGGMIESGSLRHYYDHSGLLTYFQTLREVIHAVSPNCDYVPLFPSSDDHQITIGYNTKMCCWVLCDANDDPPIQHVTSDWIMAIKVMFAFFPEYQLHTRIYGTKDQEAILNPIFEQWVKHSRMEMVHGVERQHSLSKTKPIVAPQHESLGLAILSGNIALAQFALRGSDINAEIIERRTPLMLAVSCEIKTMVEWLISEGADVNRPTVFKIVVSNESIDTEKESLTFPIELSRGNKTTDILNLLLCSRVTCDVEQVSLLLRYFLAPNKKEHFKALLKNARPGVKEALLDKDTGRAFLLSLEGESIEIRLEYIACDELLEYLLNWLTDFYDMTKWLRLLPVEERISFIHRFPIEKLKQWPLGWLSEIIPLLLIEEAERLLLSFFQDGPPSTICEASTERSSGSIYFTSSQ